MCESRCFGEEMFEEGKTRLFFANSHQPCLTNLDGSGTHLRGHSLDELGVILCHQIEQRHIDLQRPALRGQHQPLMNHTLLERNKLCFRISTLWAINQRIEYGTTLNNVQLVHHSYDERKDGNLLFIGKVAT